ncbi:MAG: Mur ligase domain-containing protein, partial [Bdellovibrionales bacterium]|nr:Mur ligase domain-containing protein [Bdellovibrionales bacterium]
MTNENRPVSSLELKPGAHVHFMGICGTAMASLAGLLHSRGFKVTGSDQNVYPPMSTQLQSLGITIMQGYKKENLSPRPDLVIVGNVISRQSEEAQALLATDIPYTSLPQALGALVIENRHSIVVAGTHGKTTSTAMNAYLAERLGLQPGFMIGGIPKNFGQSYRNAEGDWFVIEGDEYDTAFFDKVPKFVHYRPRSVILNSVEFDHADIYRDLDHVKESFFKLLDLIPQGGRLIACEDEETIRDLLAKRRDALKARDVRVITFGLERGDYRAQNITSVPLSTPLKDKHDSAKALRLGTRFDLVRPTGPTIPITLPTIGTYNVKNAMASIALWESLGFSAEKVIPLFLGFEGVKRRQEIIGTPGGVTVIEDFAHHPTAVRETIRTVQTQYPNAHVFSVFEARSATSRRNVFQNEYASAFIGARTQDLLLPPPFNLQGLPEDHRFSTEKLLDQLQAEQIKARVLPDVDHIVAEIQKE